MRRAQTGATSAERTILSLKLRVHFFKDGLPGVGVRKMGSVANQVGSERERPVISRSEGESNPASDGTVGLSELRRESRPLCWPEAGGLEHEGAPTNGGIRPWAEPPAAPCISPDIGGVEDGFESPSKTMEDMDAL